MSSTALFFVAVWLSWAWYQMLVFRHHQKVQRLELQYKALVQIEYMRLDAQLARERLR